VRRGLVEVSVSVRVRSREEGWEKRDELCVTKLPKIGITIELPLQSSRAKGEIGLLEAWGLWWFAGG